MTMSPKFVVEHRSALNGTEINVLGLVVNFISTASAFPRFGEMPCASSTVTLSDTLDPARDKHYDVDIYPNSGAPGTVMVNEVPPPGGYEKIYQVGSTVDVTALDVRGSKTELSLKQRESE